MIHTHLHTLIIQIYARVNYTYIHTYTQLYITLWDLLVREKAKVGTPGRSSCGSNILCWFSNPQSPLTLYLMGPSTHRSCTQWEELDLTSAAPLRTSSLLRDNDSRLNYTGILKLAEPSSAEIWDIENCLQHFSKVIWLLWASVSQL